MEHKLATKLRKLRLPPRQLWEQTWALRLYVAGQSPHCLAAFRNLKHLCEQHLTGKYTIEVVDLFEHPQLSRNDQILAIPTLIRKLPKPMRRIVGDLSNCQGVLAGLDLRSRSRS